MPIDQVDVERDVVVDAVFVLRPSHVLHPEGEGRGLLGGVPVMLVAAVGLLVVVQGREALVLVAFLQRNQRDVGRPYRRGGHPEHRRQGVERVILCLVGIPVGDRIAISGALAELPAPHVGAGVAEGVAVLGAVLIGAGPVPVAVALGAVFFSSVRVEPVLPVVGPEPGVVGSDAPPVQPVDGMTRAGRARVVPGVHRGR